MPENQINKRSNKKFILEERKNYYLAWKKSELNRGSDPIHGKIYGFAIASQLSLI